MAGFMDFLGGALASAPQLLERRRQFDAEQEARKQQQQFQQVQMALQMRDQELQEDNIRRTVLKEALASLQPGTVHQNLDPELTAYAAKNAPGRLQQQDATLGSTQFVPGMDGTPEQVASPGLQAGMRVAPTVIEQAQLDTVADSAQMRKMRNSVIAELESGRAFAQPPQKLDQLRALGAAVGIQVPASYDEWKQKQDYEQKQRLEVVDAQGRNTIAAAGARNVYAGSTGGGGLGDDARAIAEAIKRGDQPPTLTGLYRGGLPVRAELARSGYDLTTATRDWQALTRYMSSLNGPQQLRLQQATEFVAEGVPLVRQLNAELSAAVPRGQMPVLNRASLAAAQQGTFGPEAQAAATKLNTQIAEMQSELAVMYRGGNASTDEALKKASQILQADWSQPQLTAALDLLDSNIAIRRNSIRNVNVGMPNGEANQYVTQPAAGGATGPAGASPAAVGDPLGIRTKQ